MDTINLNLNPGDILKASDISVIVDAINGIILLLNGQITPEQQSNIVEKVKALISFGSYDVRTMPALCHEGINNIGLPHGLWLLSYLSSDLVNPIKTRLLSQDELLTYLGDGYHIFKDLTVSANSNVFRNELTGERLSIHKYDGSSVTGNDLGGQEYYVEGVPSLWDVFAYEKYWDYVSGEMLGPNYTFQNLGVELGQRLIVDGTPSQDSARYAIKFQGTFGFGNSSLLDANSTTKTLYVPINPQMDLILELLFCVIPSKMCTWSEFKSNPKTYIDLIKENEKNSILIDAEEQLNSDNIKVIKDRIENIATRDTNNIPARFIEGIDSYLNLKSQYYRKRKTGLNVEHVAFDIIIEYFKTKWPSFEGGNGVTEDIINIAPLYFYGGWSASENRYIGEQGYYFVSTSHIMDIPRFYKKYTDQGFVYTNNWTIMTKGPIADRSMAPRKETPDAQNYTYGHLYVKPGDIVVLLKNNVYYGGTNILFPILVKSPNTGLNYIEQMTYKMIKDWKLPTNYIDGEDVVEIQNEDQLDSTFVGSPNISYGRYGGNYNLYAFLANSDFVIYDTKFMNNPLLGEDY